MIIGVSLCSVRHLNKGVPGEVKWRFESSPLLSPQCEQPDSFLPNHPCSFCLPASVGALPPSGPRSSSSAPPVNPPSGLMNPSLPFTSSPDPTPSQNPLSLMMSQMSKYAMPSSTPLYHNAIKTIATSDDELLPDRPLLPPPPPPQGSGPGARTGTGLQGEELMWALGMGRVSMASSRSCGRAGFYVPPEGPGSGDVMSWDAAALKSF